MLFNSLDFLIFFPIVVALYFILPKPVKNFWLLAASYYFYMCWNAKYAVLILFSTAITYLSGILIEKAGEGQRSQKVKHRLKNLTVAFSFTLNLAVLFFFKYINFFTGILSDAFGCFGVELNIPAFDVLLPVGISFYTFQALSYTMDVYRGEIYAEKNFIRYALFVSFFPQLVAGPIERSKNLLKQIAVPRKFSFENFRDGIFLMLWGYFLKVVVADRIAIFVDTAYGDPTSFGGWYLIVATMLFAVQIYCDFGGYSVIAMGAAKILGIHLMENFNAPYLATSVADFWRRWHISLTSWFKDYLYIPLGGSRKGTFRKYLNKLIVFLVSGLWHGADLSFVIWGGLNGIYQIIGEILTPVRDRIKDFFHIKKDSLGQRILSMAITFAFVDFAWIFFRAQSFADAKFIISQMFSVHNFEIFSGKIFTCGLDEANFKLMIICILVMLFADICKNHGIKVREVIQNQNYWFRAVMIALSVCAILVFGIWGVGYNAAGFIYFQF